MNEFSEQALILKVGRFREADLWVRLFTPTKGVMTAFAFGGSKSRKRFCGVLDPLNEVLFKIKTNRGGEYLYLEEGSLLSSFRGLRGDLTRMGYAANCLKFFEAVHLGHDGSRAAYDLLMDTLAVLEEAPEVGTFFPILFRAKVTFDQGLLPELDRCGFCGAPGSNGDDGGVPLSRFHVEQGRLACPACELPKGTVIAVSRDTVEAMGRIQASGPRDWVSFPLPSEVRRQIFQIVDKFVEFHLGLSWSQGSFRRN